MKPLVTPLGSLSSLAPTPGLRAWLSLPVALSGNWVPATPALVLGPALELATLLFGTGCGAWAVVLVARRGVVVSLPASLLLFLGSAQPVHPLHLLFLNCAGLTPLVGAALVRWPSLPRWPSWWEL